RVLNVAQDVIDDTGKRSQSLASAKTAYTYDGLGNVKQLRELAEVQGNAETWETTDIAYDKLGRETKREGVSFIDYQGAPVRPTNETEYTGLGGISQRIQRGKNN